MSPSLDKQTAGKQLRERAQEYSSRISAIQRDLHHHQEPVEADFAEQVTQRENDDVLQSLLLEAEIQLKQVNAAIDRLDAGTYGDCVRCGEPVGDARLQAIPEAECCIGCAN